MIVVGRHGILRGVRSSPNHAMRATAEQAAPSATPAPTTLNGTSLPSRREQHHGTAPATTTRDPLVVGVGAASATSQYRVATKPGRATSRQALPAGGATRRHPFCSHVCTTAANLERPRGCEEPITQGLRLLEPPVRWQSWRLTVNRVKGERLRQPLDSVLQCARHLLGCFGLLLGLVGSLSTLRRCGRGDESAPRRV